MECPGGSGALSTKVEFASSREWGYNWLSAFSRNFGVVNLQHVGFCPEREAAGGHCPRNRRVHHAEEERGTELPGAMPVSWREDAFVFRARDAAVLSLLRVRCFGGCLQVRAGDRQGQLSGGGEDRRAEVRDRAAQAGVFLAGRGGGEPAARASTRAVRAGDGIL